MSVLAKNKQSHTNVLFSFVPRTKLYQFAEKVGFIITPLLMKVRPNLNLNCSLVSGVGETRSVLASMNSDIIHNDRSTELHILRHIGDLPEGQSHKGRPIGHHPSTSRDHKVLGSLMDSQERMREVIHLRNALSDHSQMSSADYEPQVG